MDKEIYYFSKPLESNDALHIAVLKFEKSISQYSVLDFPYLIEQYFKFIKHSNYSRNKNKRSPNYKIQYGLCLLCDICKIDSLQVDYLVEKKFNELDKNIKNQFIEVLSTEIFNCPDFYDQSDYYGGIKVLYNSIGHYILSQTSQTNEIKKYMNALLSTYLRIMLNNELFYKRLEDYIKMFIMLFDHWSIFGENWILQATSFFTEYTLKYFSLDTHSEESKRIQTLYEKIFTTYERYVTINGLQYRLLRTAFIFVGHFYKTYNVNVREYIINYCNFFIPDDLVFVYFEHILPNEKSITIRSKILDILLNLQQFHKDDMICMSKYIFRHLLNIADNDKSSAIRSKCLDYIVNSARCEKEYFIPLLLSRIQDVNEDVQMKALNMFLSYHIEDEVELVGKDNMLKTMKMIAFIKKETTNSQISLICEMIINKDCFNYKSKYTYGSEKDNIAARLCEVYEGI